MSAFLLAFIVVLMAKTLAGIYLGGAYACPSCGTRREDEHAEECPWVDDRSRYRSASELQLSTSPRSAS
jgi:hypothetical protein